MTEQQTHTNIQFRGHLPALDGVRGLAILLVLLSHFTLREYWPTERIYFIVQSGWIGVDLFFVLSGFLITGILLDSKGKGHYFSHFYRRRILRIFPLYYFVVIVTWVTVVFLEKAPERLQGFDSFTWFFTFTPNVAMGLKNEYMYHSFIFNLNHLWSLAVEEQFYLLWPLIVWLLPMRVLAVLCLVLLAMSTGLRNLTDHIVGEKLSVASYVFTFCRMDGLAIGAFVAAALRLNWIQKIPYHFWIARGLLLLTGWEIVQLFIHGTKPNLWTLSSLFCAATLILALNPDQNSLTRRICETPVLVHLGKFSYGLYVFHHMLNFEWENWFGKPLVASSLHPVVGQILYMSLAFAGTYLLARASWKWIEQPFLKLK
ncbi:MAG: acyltransferase [Saprospiraceae bacterium]|nr:acyltransferase [Saprospiraceae bacterium]